MDEIVVYYVMYHNKLCFSYKVVTFLKSIIDYLIIIIILF